MKTLPTALSVFLGLSPALTTHLTAAAGTPLDTNPPVVSVTFPTNDIHYLREGFLEFRGTASDDVVVRAVWAEQLGAGYKVTVVGREEWTARRPVDVGTNTYVFQAEDNAGNFSLLATQVVVRAPTVLLRIPWWEFWGGKVVGASHGDYLDIGQTVTLKAWQGVSMLFSNWVGSITSTNQCLTFVALSNMTLIPNFVPSPFFRLKGNYTGLFYNTNSLSQGLPGAFTLYVTELGTFVIKLVVDGRTSFGRGRFGLTVNAVTSVELPGRGPPLDIHLHIHGVSHKVTGTLSNATHISHVQGYRMIARLARPPVPTLVGTYTMGLSAGSDPPSGIRPSGMGFGSVLVRPNGSVRFKGWLGDGTPLTQASKLAGPGLWPFYAPLYHQRQGVLIGWLSVPEVGAQEQTVDGQLLWIQPGGIERLHYLTGFTNLIEASGSRYVQPPRRTSVLGSSDAVAILNGGNLGVALTNDLHSSRANRITGSWPDPNQLSLRFNRRNGLIRGRFTHPQTERRTRLRGVWLQSQRLGLGQFLGADETGAVYIGDPADYPSFQ